MRRGPAPRHPPDLVQPAIGGAVDDVLGVRAGAVVGGRGAGRRRGARRRREIPAGHRRDASPVELPQVPVIAAIDDLVGVVVRRVVGDRVARGRRGAGDAGQVVEAAGAVRPVQAEDVAMHAAVDDDVDARRVDERRRDRPRPAAPRSSP